MEAKLNEVLYFEITVALSQAHWALLLAGRPFQKACMMIFFIQFVQIKYVLF
jgi:hypothetical protein